MLHAVRASLLLPDCRPLTTVHAVHHWLYVYGGTPHRDPSPDNTIWRPARKNRKRKKERKVHGVLTDYDLSSFVETVKPDYTKTSQQRTRTPPHMALGLLRETSPLQPHRQDLESLFYMMKLWENTLGVLPSLHRSAT